MSDIPEDIKATAKDLSTSAVFGMCKTADHGFGLMDRVQQEAKVRHFSQIAYHDVRPIIERAIWAERQRAAKIAAGEAEYAMETYEGARLHDFLSVSRHIEAQIMMKPHQRDKMRGISYPSQAILNQT